METLLDKRSSILFDRDLISHYLVLCLSSCGRQSKTKMLSFSFVISYPLHDTMIHHLSIHTLFVVNREPVNSKKLLKIGHCHLRSN